MVVYGRDAIVARRRVAQEGLDVCLRVVRCVAEQSIEWCFGGNGPIDHLGSVNVDEELGVLVEEGARWHATSWAWGHSDLLCVAKVHG